MYVSETLFDRFFFFFKQKTAYEMRISDWSSDVCSSDLGWLAIACLGAAYQVVEARTDIAAPDNLLARSRRTRISILYRIGVFLVLLVTICMMLISIPSVRNVGVTLIASAGLAGLAVGAAAQPALKNLIAGIQMAFTEPIRIDD